MTVTVDGNDYNVAVAGGKGILVIPDLKAGNYTVDVVYLGDGRYESSVNGTKFSVNKVVAGEVKVIDQNNGTVVVVVPENATGNVTITVDNETYTVPVVNGTAVVTLTNVTPGEHNVTVIYSGDDTYDSVVINSTVTVPKDVDYDMDVDVSNINVGDTEVITVTLPANATGSVTIEIDGQVITKDLDGGIATFEVTGLSAGNKTVEVYYSGDDTYAPNSTTAKFTVSKVESGVNVTVENIDVGDVAVIEVTVPSDATGWVHVTVDNVTYAVKINDGKASIEVPGLASGEHDINVTYLGDDKYLPSGNETAVEVSKVPSTVVVSVDNITVGDKAVIEITVPGDATGNVTVTVDGNDYNVAVAGGKGILVIPDLKAGNYTVDVVYLGDGRYESSVNGTKFSVNKVVAGEVKVIDQNNGTVVVVVPENATGNVTITVDNETYTVPVVNGTAVITLNDTVPGEHNVTIIYSGDDTYDPVVINSTVTVPKDVDYDMDVDVSNINVGDTEVITVTLPANATGSVTIEIDGQVITKDLEGGVATFDVANLTAGNKTVAVSYSGDDTYDGKSTTAKFTVSKVESGVNVTVENIDVGDVAVINVTVPDDATGWVHVTVDNVTYAVEIVDGKVSIEIPGLVSGDYNINVTYLGDDKYLPSSNGTTVDVSKVGSFIIISVDNITVGDKAIITVTVPGDATGNVTVNVGDDTYSVNVTGGTGVLVVPGLKVGNYTVVATYNGDDKYNSSENSTDLSVDKIISNIKIVDQGNGTVVVVVPEKATGTVIIQVGEDEFGANVADGIAVINLDGVTPGEHNVTATYSGDENHTGTSANSTVTMPKYDTPVNVDVSNIEVGDTEKITVTLPENATGTVTIEIDGKVYNTTDIQDGAAKFDVDNLTAGNKTVTVTYSGDDNYLGNTTTASFEVSKRDSSITVSADNIKVGENVTVTVIVPLNATGQVLVDVAGEQYYINITDGTGFVTIPHLSEGEYTVTTSYVGDNQYLPSSNKTSFKVYKHDSQMNVTFPDDSYLGKDSVIIVTLPDDATGTVTITVDGEEYNVVPAGGEITIPLVNLTGGVHEIEVTYSGDDWYSNATETGKAAVAPVEIETNGTDIIITVPENETNAIKVIIDGVETIYEGSDLTNTTVDISLENVTPGLHNVTFIITDKDGNEYVIDETLDVDKKQADMEIEIPEIIIAGDNLNITVILPDDATGNITATLDGGKQIIVPVINGTAVIPLENITAGDHIIEVEYSGDDKYMNVSKSENFAVAPRGIATVIYSMKEFTRIATDYAAGERGGWYYVLLKDIDGNPLANQKVQIAVNGPIYNITTDREGRAGLKINLASANTYTYAIFYQGDEIYNASLLASSKLIVTKKPMYITASNQVFKASATTKTVTVTLSTVINKYDGKMYLKDGKKVTLTINGKTYTAYSDAKGVVKFNIGGLTKKGTYNAVIKFEGDKTYEAASLTIKVTLDDKGSTTATVVTTAPKVANPKETEMCPLDITTPIGSNIPTTNVVGGKKNTVIEVDKEFTRVATDYNAGERGGYFYAIVKDTDGNLLANKTIQIAVNGPIYYVTTDENGRAALMINLASANTYTYALAFSGDDEYNGAALASSKLIVTKKPITITAKDQTFKSTAKTKTVTATLSTSKNPYDNKTYLKDDKKVTLKVDGKTYTGTINSEGKVSFNVDITNKGTYSAVISFAGDRTYDSATKTIKITIN